MTSDKQTIKELKAEIAELKECMTVFSKKLYEVDLTVWENGSGSGQGAVALCRSIKDATLVAVGLRSTLPGGFHSECGDSKIARDVRIEVSPCHISDVRSFVKAEQW